MRFRGFAAIAMISFLYASDCFAVPEEYNTVCKLDNIQPTPSPYHGMTYYKLLENHTHGNLDNSSCTTDKITHPVHIIKVDLQAAGIEPLVRPESNNTVTTFDWVTKNDVNAAINTGFGGKDDKYKEMKTCTTSTIAAIGYQKSEGKDYTCYHNITAFPVVGFDENNQFMFVSPEQMGSDVEKEVKSKLYNAVSAYVFTLIKDGNIAKNEFKGNSWGDTDTDAKVKSLYTTPHPRTALGIDKTGRYFYMVVVDGRRKDMTGMSLEELSYCFKNMGAYQAFNLDGGGSSTMVMENLVKNSSCQGCSNAYAQCKNVSCTSTSLRKQYVHLGFRSLVKNAVEIMPQKTDIDGDGKADICIRGKDGLMCAFSSESGLKKYRKVLDFGDEHGWDDVSNYASFLFADINGDGKADICARANKGISCRISEGTSFSDGTPVISMPDSASFDDNGYNNVMYYSTIRGADIDGDGRDEICARFIDGFKCYAWNDNAWENPVELGDMGDSVSWGSHEYYSTIRMADVDGDGKIDVCGRGKKGFRCWISDGNAFGSQFTMAPWSNENGWNNPDYYDTIRMADVNGDGKSDVCARDKDGIVCYLSNGAAMGQEVRGPSLPDSSGWNDFDNNSTLRFADINGDDKSDVCIRANKGMQCYLATDDGFEETPYVIADMSNNNGWNRPEQFMSIRTGDINGDHREEICGRDASGIVCYAFIGTGFARINGIAVDDDNGDGSWRDENGWNRPQYYTTLRLGGIYPKSCTDSDPFCGDCDGQWDENGICQKLSDEPEPTTPDEPEPTTPDEPDPMTPDEPEPTTPDKPEPTTPDEPEPTTPDEPEPTTPDEPGIDTSGASDDCSCSIRRQSTPSDIPISALFLFGFASIIVRRRFGMR